MFEENSKEKISIALSLNIDETALSTLFEQYAKTDASTPEGIEAAVEALVDLVPTTDALSDPTDPDYYPLIQKGSAKTSIANCYVGAETQIWRLARENIRNDEGLASGALLQKLRQQLGGSDAG